MATSQPSNTMPTSAGGSSNGQAAQASGSPSIVVQGELTDLSSPSNLHLALAQLLPSEEQEDDLDEETASIQKKASRGHGGDFAKLTAYARRAAREGADVVAFPEYFLTGATHDSWYKVRDRGGPTPHSKAALYGSAGEEASQEHADQHRREEQEEHWLDEVCSLAKELDINIVAGTVVELGHAHEVKAKEGKGSRDSLFNTAYFVGREGHVRGRYTKRNLWHPERKPLTAAAPDTHPAPLLFTFTTRRGRTLTAGMQICWDLAFPESSRSLLQPSEDSDATSSVPGPKRGPDVIFAPTCWYATDGGAHGLRWNPFGEAALLDSLTLTRALECESILAMINIAGRPYPEGFAQRWLAASPEEKRRIGLEMTRDDVEPVGVGRTTVVAPFVGSIGRLDGPEEALLLATVDLAILDDIRETYKIRQDLAEAES